MKTSRFLLATIKETPTEALLVSHKLMLRAGMIRKLASGIYTWLPLGLRVLKKVEHIVREEMNRIGAQEILMPSLQPKELWEESGRWDFYGKELLKLKDRHDRDFCYGPTHEEVITDVMRGELNSYRQLPMTFYQIQTKFRDEIRPRFGIMRGREFLMKDAYSFATNMNDLKQEYEAMYRAYSNIFSRLYLNFRAVIADTGSIGGSASHEFQVLAQSGEDIIAYSNESDYAANLELAAAAAPAKTQPELHEPVLVKHTPDIKTIEQLSQFLNIPPKLIVKTIVLKDSTGKLIAVALRGDHELNLVKVSKLPGITAPVELASEIEIENTLQCSKGFIGVKDLHVPLMIDREVAVMSNFVCGANKNDYHLLHVHWERDAKLPEIFDIRNVAAGDPSPDGKGVLQLQRGIEVGHIFQLGKKYSEAMGLSVLDQSGKPVVLEMGCYGIGVSRTVAAAIEQNHDQNGIIWPAPMAPFDAAIVPINFHKSEAVKKEALKLYETLQNLGIEVLLDDRNERAGVMFADMDLIGIPHRIVISDRLLEKNSFEYKNRRETKSRMVDEEGLMGLLKNCNEK